MQTEQPTIRKRSSLQSMAAGIAQFAAAASAAIAPYAEIAAGIATATHAAIAPYAAAERISAAPAQAGVPAECSEAVTNPALADAHRTATTLAATIPPEQPTIRKRSSLQSMAAGIAQFGAAVSAAIAPYAEIAAGIATATHAAIAHAAQHAWMFVQSSPAYHWHKALRGRHRCVRNAWVQLTQGHGEQSLRRWLSLDETARWQRVEQRADAHAAAPRCGASASCLTTALLIAPGAPNRAVAA